MILSACSKTMRKGGDLHTTLAAMPPRRAVATADVVAATGIHTKLAHAYLQVHEKRGNVSRQLTQLSPRRVAWTLLPRGRAMLARVAR